MKSWRHMVRPLPVTGGRICSRLYSVSLTTWSYLSNRMRWVGGDWALCSVSFIIYQLLLGVGFLCHLITPSFWLTPLTWVLLSSHKEIKAFGSHCRHSTRTHNICLQNVEHCFLLFNGDPCCTIVQIQTQYMYWVYVYLYLF